MIYENPQGRVVPVPQELLLTRAQIFSRLSTFGFIEIADILCYLESACAFYPDKNAYRYIRNKIKGCLSVHDNGSEYFIPLRELVSELDCLI